MKPCHHVDYRSCCLACEATDIETFELKEASKKETEFDGLLKAHDQVKVVSLAPTARKLHDAKRVRLTTQLEAWSQRRSNLADLSKDYAKRIDSFCKEHGSSDLPLAFEDDAASREDQLLQMVRAKTGIGELGFTQYVPEDSLNKVQYHGESRANKLSTPDFRVDDGEGLDMFVALSTSARRLPTQAVGLLSGPAVMSLGAAVAEHGLPPGPGHVTPILPSRSLGKLMALCDIGDAAAPAKEVDTTSEPEEQQTDNPPLVQCLIPADAQWKFLVDTKYILTIGVLASQYRKLVLEKIQADKQISEKVDEECSEAIQSGESSKTDELQQKGPSQSGWPSVEDMSWSGFLNWLRRCTEQQPKFGSKVLNPWGKDRNSRQKELAEKLGNWKAGKNFDDGSSKHPDPRNFYDHHRMLAELDADEGA